MSLGKATEFQAEPSAPRYFNSFKQMT